VLQALGSHPAEKSQSAKLADLSAIVPGAGSSQAEREEFKMVLCVNQDLKMSKGKVAAQCCHAAVAVVQSFRRRMPLWFRAWEKGGQAKIALKVESTQQLLNLANQGLLMLPSCNRCHASLFSPIYVGVVKHLMLTQPAQSLVICPHPMRSTWSATAHSVPTTAKEFSTSPSPRHAHQKFSCCSPSSTSAILCGC
jgi:peptidyl-tRNA hydrolase